jgi:hypothetical protein
MTTQHMFDAMFEEKLNTLMPYLVKTTRGDEDLIQEGAIGIWESMKKVPYAVNKYHATKAKWNIWRWRQKGVMVREERLPQSPTGAGVLVRGPFTTGRVNNNLVSGEPGALQLFQK